MSIIIHVGFPKTGTTFLQNEIFKKLPDYSDHPIIAESGIVSFEALALSETAPFRLKKIFPDARIIIITRDPQGLRRSLYKHYIRSGGWKDYKKWQEDLDVRINQRGMIETYRRLFNDVYIDSFENLKSEPRVFIDRLCSWMGTTPPPYKVRQYNVSYGAYRLRIARFMNRYLSPRGKVFLRRLLSLTGIIEKYFRVSWN